MLYSLGREYSRMDVVLSQKSRAMMEHIDSMVPATADAEINFALKCYYLGKEHTEEQIIAIMTHRMKELEELKEQMTITSYAELDKPVEETKCDDNVNGEDSSDDTINT